MALSIVSNQAASIATRSLEQANNAATATAEKLSSGKRINSAADDAAGSAIAARLSAEVAGLQQAGVNAGQASSLLQIADGAFQNVEDILTRAKSLSVQAGSEQISDQERAFLDQEFQSLKDEIDRIANDTEFNGANLVNGDVEGFVDGGASVTITKDVVGGGTGMATVMSLSTAGFQGIAAMGLQLSSGSMSALSGNATAPVQLGSVMYATGNGGFQIGGLNVMTTGGASTAANFTGNLQDADGNTLAGTLAITMDARITLMATNTMVDGTITVSIGTAFAPAADITVADGAGFTGAEAMNFSFKVGTGTTASEDEISVDIGGITNQALGLSNASIDSKANADTASDLVSSAIDALQAKRSDVGAAQNRLDFASQNVDLARENQEAARSELEDLNVAKAITEFSQQQLLVQAGTSTLSQANSLPQNLLQLFR
ncbi:flagellin [Rhodovibrio salinarum]|uniref:Flagellin n=1 Tax=Rhodovibrio salinarum TaxID=1087 RepID=A0A934V0E0_9PROT|nr:flagellin [Rhodovibrio salinarum]MBK1697708.1 flagellin [Rhodovibrio salinarum]